MAIAVPAQPYAFALDEAAVALVVIDMQRDFVEPGGFGASLGNDVSRLEAIVPTVARLLALARRRGWRVLHTRESHRPDLSDCPPAKRLRGNAALRIGDAGPMGRILVQGEPGNAILDAVAPIAGETVIDKPGKGMFFATNVADILAIWGTTQLVFAGFECLLVEDATQSYFEEFKQATLAMIRAQGAIVGWTAPLLTLESAVEG
jgi:biuret amidohydrolase